MKKSVREFAEAEIPPKIEAMEKTGEFPIELLEPMARLGITGIIAPPEYGGVGLGLSGQKPLPWKSWVGCVRRFPWPCRFTIWPLPR